MSRARQRRRRMMPPDDTTADDEGKRGPGRPTIEDRPLEGQINLRCSMEQKRKYVRAARAKDQKLARWILEKLDAAVAKELPEEK